MDKKKGTARGKIKKWKGNKESVVEIKCDGRKSESDGNKVGA